MRARFVSYCVIALVLLLGSTAWAQSPTEDDEYSGVPLCANPFDPKGPGIGVTGYFALQASGTIGGVQTHWIGVANFTDLGNVTVSISQVQDSGRTVFTDIGKAVFTRNCRVEIALAHHPIEGVRVSDGTITFQTDGAGELLSGRLQLIRKPNFRF